MAGLRIGVNALYLVPGGVGGTEIYLRSLLNALAEIDTANRYVVFTNRETGSDLPPARSNFSHVSLAVRAANRPARILWEQTALPVAAARERLDTLFNPGFTCPMLSPCPTVTVFHDLQHKRHPEYFRWFDLPFWRAFLFLSACLSTRVICVSEATRADLLRYYPIPGSKTRVIPHGVDESFFEIGRRRKQEVPRPYLLCVSTLHPHKNLERLIRAYARFQQRCPEFQLVLAGMLGFRTGAVEQLIADLGLADSVRITGWIPRQELYDLFLHASAFLYPSTFEGFGMPVLEALAAGIPSACSAIEPVRSVAASAALLFDPDDENAIEEAMWLLTSDAELRERLAREGPRRAADFSWHRAAEETLEEIQRAAGR